MKREWKRGHPSTELWAEGRHFTLWSLRVRGGRLVALVPSGTGPLTSGDIKATFVPGRKRRAR